MSESSFSNTGNYLVKTCGQIFDLRVRFFTYLNAFACVTARARFSRKGLQLVFSPN